MGPFQITCLLAYPEKDPKFFLEPREANNSKQQFLLVLQPLSSWESDGDFYMGKLWASPWLRRRYELYSQLGYLTEFHICQVVTARYHSFLSWHQHAISSNVLPINPPTPALGRRLGPPLVWTLAFPDLCPDCFHCHSIPLAIPANAPRHHLHCTAPKLPDTPRPGPTERSKRSAAAPLFIVPLRNCIVA